MPRSIIVIAGLLLAALLIVINIKTPPATVQFTATDDAMGIVAARKFAGLAPVASLVLIAYGNDDGAPAANLRRRDAFVSEAAALGLRITSIVSPLEAHKGQRSLMDLPLLDSGIDASSVAIALNGRPSLVVSLEGVPARLDRLDLGGARFFAIDPYMTTDWRPLMKQGRLHALLTYRDDADWSHAFDTPEAIEAARFRFITP